MRLRELRYHKDTKTRDHQRIVRSSSGQSGECNELRVDWYWSIGRDSGSGGIGGTDGEGVAKPDDVVYAGERARRSTRDG